ncbi:MAG: protein kinase, partial [Bacteroidetes bacterium]|nr:protein kinase [Bacteroidota bacterium]
MEAAQWHQVSALFDALVDCSPAEQQARLDAAGAEAAVRTRVEALLAADRETPSFVDAGVDDLASMLALGPPPALHQDEQIGAYRLTQRIGHGGMGVVYRAQRTDGAFAHDVAIKLLPRYLETQESIARFRVERQILATLNHPGIARLLDGGVTTDGTPYLVMEYVQGVPISTYVAQHRCTLDVCLHLIRDVLDAVHHAHANLVIHRDLKPSNILVTDTGQVKLLDFGIAKLVEAPLGGPALPVTRTGDVLLTPRYAAPEQMTGDAITTATDIYQVGILAYELLTNQCPFDLEGKSLTEVERTILHQAPPPPSRAVDADATDPLECRRARALRGDLDTVILKALRKDPAERYPSATSFAADLERCQTNRPVEARPATLRYRFGLFACRNRRALTAAVLVVLLFAGVLGYHFQRLSTERDMAQHEASKAEAATAFLVDLFESSDPFRHPDDAVSARTLLERGQDRIQQLGAEPIVQAAMLHAMGEAYHGLGRYEAADSMLQAALHLRRTHLGAHHLTVGASLLALGKVHLTTHRHQDALALLQEAQVIWDAHGVRDERRVSLLRKQAQGLSDVGEPDSALVLLRQAVALHEANTGTPPGLPLKTDLAYVLRRTGAVAEAEAIYRDVLTEQRTTLGPTDPALASTLNNLAYLLTHHYQDHGSAEPLYREVVAIQEEALGAGHPRTLMTRGNNLYASLRHQEKYAEADTLLRAQLSVVRAHYAA